MKKTVIVQEFSEFIENEETIPVVPEFFVLNSDSSKDIVVTGNKISWQYLSVRVRI
jgi:hypothetical protein